MYPIIVSIAFQPPKKKSLLLVSRDRDKAKNCNIWAKKPFTIVAENAVVANWLTIYEKIRTEFEQN